MNFPGLLQVGELLEPCFNCLKAYLQTRSPYFLELVEEKPLKPFPSGRTKIIVKDF